MIKEILEQRENFVDAEVPIAIEIRRTVEHLGQNPVVVQAMDAVSVYAADGNLSKKEVLDIWGYDTVSFAAKCLVTLWWGHPSRFVSHLVYSQRNMDILADPQFEASFQEVTKSTDIAQFLERLKALFRLFERNGDYHLDGVNVAFFTKIFHFYFWTHPCDSCRGFLPVIADKWMKLAVYAEMADNGDNSRYELFTVQNGNPDSIDFRYVNNSAAESYIEYITYFNNKVSLLKGEYPHLSPFILEDILFNDSQQITPLFVRKDFNALFLPPWIAGRYNEPSHSAILFNNLLGESYLFEEGSAMVIGELLKTEYWRSIDVNGIMAALECTECELLSFFVELKNQHVIEDHILSEEEIQKIRKHTAVEKKKFLKKSNGTENLQSIFEIADTDYRDRIESQMIPTTVSFELTYACNEICLHCYNPGSLRTECIAKKAASDEMVYEDYCSVLDQLADMGVPKVLFSGGDPFMKKDFIKILKYAHSKKFAVSIYTNGQSLYNHPQYYQDIVNCYPYNIGLSLYSIEPEIHEKITRVKGSCEKTKAIAEKLSKDGVGLLIKCPIMRVNKESYKKVYKYAIGLNAVPEFEVNITSSVEGDNYAVENLRLNEEEMTKLLRDPLILLSTERKNVARMMERSPQMHFCGAGTDSVNIKPNGDVAPCIAFTAPCGNVKTTPFREIWNNSDYLKRVRTLTYADSDRCGKESYCKYCNRCMGQSFTEHGVPENMSIDNCFIAKIQEKIDSTR